jgi:hypothetical protein
MCNGLARCKALCRFAELLSLDNTVNPPIKDLDDRRSWLDVLGPH